MPRKIQYTLVQEDETSTLTAYKVPDFDKPQIVDSTHVKWDEILAGVLADDLEVLRLINIADTLADSLISERLTVIGGRLCFDGDEVDDALSQFVVKMIAAGDPNYPAYVKFVEKLYSNPQAHSREHLFTYLRKYDVTITTEGDLLLYKGVNRAPENQNFGGQKPWRSGSQGPANVSGYEHLSGYVPQAVGDVVSMPRTATWTNPTVACSTGLHVATWGYWHSNYGVNLLVLVNPRDVVSVPHDDAKIRCCRYKIIADNVTAKIDALVTPVFIPAVPTFIPAQEVADEEVAPLPEDPTVGFSDEWWDAYDDEVEDEDEEEEEEITEDDEAGISQDTYEYYDFYADVQPLPLDEDTYVTAVAISPDGTVQSVTESINVINSVSAGVFDEKTGRVPTEQEWLQSIANAKNQKKSHLAYLTRLKSWDHVQDSGGGRLDWLVNN